jgi:hypothetical protein
MRQPKNRKLAIRAMLIGKDLTKGSDILFVVSGEGVRE